MLKELPFLLFSHPVFVLLTRPPPTGQELASSDMQKRKTLQKAKKITLAVFNVTSEGICFGSEKPHLRWYLLKKTLFFSTCLFESSNQYESVKYPVKFIFVYSSVEIPKWIKYMALLMAAATGDHVTITLITAVCNLATYVFSNGSNASVAANRYIIF